MSLVMDEIKGDISKDMDANEIPTWKESSTVQTQKSFYQSKEMTNTETIDNYDAVLFTVCDVFGRPRGKFAFGSSIKRFAKYGVEMPFSK